MSFKERALQGRHRKRYDDMCLQEFQDAPNLGRRIAQRAKQVYPALTLLANADEFLSIANGRTKDRNIQVAANQWCVVHHFGDYLG